MLLTEQEITEIVREAARGSAIRRDGTTSFRIARAIEAKVIEKIKAQGAVAWHFKSPLGFVKLQKDNPCMVSPEEHNWSPLYRLSDGD